MTGYKQRKKVKKNGLEDFLPADFRGLARMKSKRLGALARTALCNLNFSPTMTF